MTSHVEAPGVQKTQGDIGSQPAEQHHEWQLVSTPWLVISGAGRCKSDGSEGQHQSSEDALEMNCQVNKGISV